MDRVQGDNFAMSTAALFVWIATVLVGLVLLIIWLMEYDRDYQSAAATRLPVPVISTHALLGIGGLLVWGLYPLPLSSQTSEAWCPVS
jgi:hypothetical protein